MAAIITDQLRILNTKDFVASVASTTNSFYTWIGLPNATQVDSDWNTTPPDPRDSFNQENEYWDTMIALKKVDTTDIKQVVKKTLPHSRPHFRTIENIMMVNGKNEG